MKVPALATQGPQDVAEVCHAVLRKTGLLSESGLRIQLDPQRNWEPSMYRGGLAFPVSLGSTEMATASVLPASMLIVM